MLMTSAPATIWRRGWRVAPAAGALNLPAATGLMDLPAAAGGRTGGQRLTTTAIGEADDEILAGLIAAGDQRAFGEIVRRHGGRLRALALRFAGGAADADDIVQETFLSFWRMAGRWQPGGAPLGAYLTRIAINRAIDGDRRRRVRRFFGLEAADAVATRRLRPTTGCTAGRRWPRWPATFGPFRRGSGRQSFLRPMGSGRTARSRRP